MFPNEYVMHERHKDLLREADQRRLASEVMQPTSLMQRMSRTLLGLGAYFAAPDHVECVTVEIRVGQTVTVCPA